jgi:hypothetical protein
MNRAQQPMTRRETVHGGSTPASMRVMVIANCDRFTSLAVNDLTGNVVKLLNDMLYTLNLVPFTAGPLTFCISGGNGYCT